MGVRVEFSKSAIVVQRVANDLVESLGQAAGHTAKLFDGAAERVKGTRVIPVADGDGGGRVRRNAVDEPTDTPNGRLHGADTRVHAPERRNDGEPVEDSGENRDGIGPSPLVETGLGAKVDALVAKSPSLSARVAQLQRDGWKIQYGPEGDGIYTELDDKIIVIDGELIRGSVYSTRVLSHEVGHALYPKEFVPLTSGMTRDQWVSDRVGVMMKMEGEAELITHQTFREIMDNDGLQPDQIRKFPVPYMDIYDRHVAGELTRDEARIEVGRNFFRDEELSTGEGNYHDYYVNLYRSIWDEEVGRETF
ncbi:hypothetical protein ACFQZZ_13480 [Nocardia sp. GCM10030253]|uniref:hypothetical protein n=1 Tax=Nocardia sp. GCM10030253 TaxID=3273404 RepID=UPI00363A2602